MKKRANDHPILFQIILIIAGFVLTIVFSAGLQILGSSYNEFNISVGRIITGLLFILIFHSCFSWKKQFSGLMIILPALLFAAWNVVNHFLTHGDYAALSTEIIIFGIAPAIFEEVIFRGIFIHNLKASGKSDLVTLIISAVIFGLMHLTNAVNGDLVQALVQTGYAVVVGLVFGAIYIRSGDLFSIIIVHALIDITNRVFMGSTDTPAIAFVIFIALLAVEAIYAFILILRKPEKSENDYSYQ